MIKHGKTSKDAYIWNSLSILLVILLSLWFKRDRLGNTIRENIDRVCAIQMLGDFGFLLDKSKDHFLSEKRCWKANNRGSSSNTLTSYAYGLRELKRGNEQQALSIWQRNGQVSQLLVSQGAKLDRSDNPVDAKKWLQWAVTVDPDYRDAWYFLSLAQRNLDQDQNALSSLKRAAQVDYGTNVGKSDVYFMLGRLHQAYLNSGDWNEAWKAYEKALEADDYRFDFLYDQTLIQRGNLLIRKNRWADAVKEYQISLNQNPTSFLVREKIASALWEIEEYDRIEEVYQVGIKLDPDNVNLRLALADFYLQRNMDAKAVKLYQEILKLDPENDEAIRYLNTP